MNESTPLDERYFVWLYGLVRAVSNRNPNRSHWDLLGQLYSTPFTWFVPNDDNRAEDGRELRCEFLDETDPGSNGATNSEWLNLECSMLEMIIALARRMGFDEDKPADDRFWHILTNLGISDYTDAVYNSRAKLSVSRILSRLAERTYNYSGQGGMFPLEHPEEDQRNVEIWYQMSAYVLENDSMYE